MIWLLALQLAVGPQANYDKATRAAARMDFPAADREVDAALAKDPYFFPALRLKANLALFAHQPDIARSCLVTAVVGNPSSGEAHLALGILYYTQNAFSLAVSPLEQAHALSPRDPKPLLYLGMSYEAMSKPSEASSLYQQAEDLSPPDAASTALVLTAYGRQLSSVGKYRISIAKEQRAVRIDPASRNAHFELARALALAHSYQQAAPEGELALTLPGLEVTDAQIHLLLRDVYLALNDNDRARLHVAKLSAASHPADR